MIDSSLDQLAQQFDGFLIDQFGVLLDGAGCYPDAPAALSQLGRTGKPILLLSNSGKRAEPNQARLTKLGFARDSYRMVLSSGEAAFGLLSRRIGDDLPKGAKVWLHARDNDTSAIDGLDLRRCDDPAESDLLLVSGSQGDRIALADYRSALAPAAAKAIPMLCTNPDLEMLTPSGTCFGAGAIAESYAEMGGRVDWVGKPYPLIYAEAARHLTGIPAARILCIGDSPAHDVLGGKTAGHATALVRSGLHASLTLPDLHTLCAATAQPDFIIPAFRFAKAPL